MAHDESGADAYSRSHDRAKHVASGQMAWYAQQADETFWCDYWRSHVNDDYYRTAERHDLGRDEMGRILLSILSPEGLHLEAGCGAGYWVAALREHGLNVEGIEYSRELVQLVNARRPTLPIRNGNALAIDSPPDRYCSYLSFGVMEHRAEGPAPFLTEAFRVLRPGGTIVVTVPFFGPVRRLKARLGRYEPSIPNLPFYQFGWTETTCSESVAAAGFRVTAIHRLFLHRLLIEESPLYRRLVYARGGRIARATMSALMKGVDGHMLMIVGEKPAETIASHG